MQQVVIVDYGMGNLDSVARAVEECGAHAVVTDRASDLVHADHLILPGVGAFADGMRRLRERRLDELLTTQVMERGTPCLGICLGMQLLATKGYEQGETAGLGWIEGEVTRLQPDSSHIRIPHIGWNEVVFDCASPLFEGLVSGKDFYFVHSYHLCCGHTSSVLAHTPYCGSFASVVGQRNVFGVQFHPEKSQRVGLQLLKNFLTL